MFCIVGLGNPGEKYHNNWHNVGHLFVDYLKNELQTSNTELKILKTDCFMNLSGTFVKKLIENCKLKIENLVVVHDDLDIPLGKFKIQKGKGPELHNGIESIEQHLQTKDFWRVRIGVDNRGATSPERSRRVDGETYVLQDFRPGEKQTLKKLFPKITERFTSFFLEEARR